MRTAFWECPWQQALSGSRILNIIGKVNIEYNELEKFGIGLLITYAEMFKCNRLKTYIRIRWYASKVNDIADGLTWLRRNPNVARGSSKTAYIKEAADTCGVTPESIMRRRIDSNNDMALIKLRVFLQTYREIKNKVEQVKRPAIANKFYKEDT
jgi:hypothetical protein